MLRHSHGECAEGLVVGRVGERVGDLGLGVGRKEGARLVGLGGGEGARVVRHLGLVPGDAGPGALEWHCHRRALGTKGHNWPFIVTLIKDQRINRLVK